MGRVVACSGGCCSSFLDFLAADQIAADSAEVLLRFFDDVSGLGALLERAEHQRDSGLGVEVRTCALVSEVGDPAEAAVFNARQFQGTVASGVDLTACNTGRGPRGRIRTSVEGLSVDWRSDFGRVDAFEWTCCHIVSNEELRHLKSRRTTLPLCVFFPFGLDSAPESMSRSSEYSDSAPSFT